MDLQSHVDTCKLGIAQWSWFSLAVYDVFTLESIGCLDVCGLIGSVLEAWFVLIIVSGFELAVR